MSKVSYPFQALPWLSINSKSCVRSCATKQSLVFTVTHRRSRVRWESSIISCQEWYPSNDSLTGLSPFFPPSDGHFHIQVICLLKFARLAREEKGWNYLGEKRWSVFFPGLDVAPWLLSPPPSPPLAPTTPWPFIHTWSTHVQTANELASNARHKFQPEDSTQWMNHNFLLSTIPLLSWAVCFAIDQPLCLRLFADIL